MSRLKKPFRLILLIITLCASTFRVSADRISFTYDDAGNRISRQREIIINTRSVIGENSDTKKSYEDSISVSKIVIYPNPTYGQLRIDIIGCPSFEGSFISLYNLSGQQIETWKELSESTTIDISDYKPATYILKISVTNKVSTWKIIKL